MNNASPASPYTSWATAATNLQDAAGLAVFGDTVLVTNGVYQTGGHYLDGTNRVQIGSGVTLSSVNGPAVTIIQGCWSPGTTNGASAVRCAYMMAGSSLAGFTLTGGATISGQYGGGVKCLAVGSCVVSNCIIAGNSAYSGGGGASQGTLINCVLSGNFANVNSVSVGGGATESTLINCLLVGNHSAYSSGAAFSCTLIGCTVVGNSTGPGDSGGLASGSRGGNDIFYYNSPDDAAGPFTNCCMAQSSGLLVSCFTNAPLFANLAGGDYHLSAASPCIHAGTNVFATNSFDLDGNARIVGGVVDVGAYEFQSPIHYVSVSNTTPVSPYTNWVTAATNIQDAVDVSVAGDFVVVSNGVYNVGSRIVYGSSSNRLVVDKAMTVQSVNGPGFTTIEGFQGAAAPYGMRCVYLTNGAVLSGFSLIKGGSRSAGDVFFEESGGGAWCEAGAVMSNCVVRGDVALQYGGGVVGGTLYNCMLTNNSANTGGGGVFSNLLVSCTLSNNSSFLSGGGAHSSRLINCLIVGNKLVQGSGGGGAAYGSLSNCLVIQNFAPGFGGGTYYSAVDNCVISNNSGSFGGGVSFGVINNSLISSNSARVTGFGGGAFSNTLNNCILQNNLAGMGGGAYNSALFNCTVVSNVTAGGTGGGLFGGGASNCIVYYNASVKGTNYQDAVMMSYCCTWPKSTNGFGNFDAPPVFVDLASRNLNLQSNSPCINAGNNAFVVSTTDFDGNARIKGGTVDIGAYEYQSPLSTVSYAYLQQYGLPTDGTADNVDTDGDGFTTAQEWRAGTDPTNAASLLQMTTTTNSVSGPIITWQSVAGVTYLVQRGADLTAQPAFSTIQSNIVGQSGTTSYTDTNGVGAAQFFYRVGVQ